MQVTPLRIKTLVRLKQLPNAVIPNVVDATGIVTLARLVQSENV